MVSNLFSSHTMLDARGEWCHYFIIYRSWDTTHRRVGWKICTTTPFVINHPTAKYWSCGNVEPAPVPVTSWGDWLPNSRLARVPGRIQIQSISWQALEGMAEVIWSRDYLPYGKMAAWCWLSPCGNKHIEFCPDSTMGLACHWSSLHPPPPVVPCLTEALWMQRRFIWNILQMAHHTTVVSQPIKPTLHPREVFSVRCDTP